MDEKNKLCTLAELRAEIDGLKQMVSYVITCQATIEAILQAKGITSHKEIYNLVVKTNGQPELLQTALNKLKEISDQA